MTRELSERRREARWEHRLCRGPDVHDPRGQEVKYFECENSKKADNEEKMRRNVAVRLR